MALTIKVNGVDRAVDVESDTPLLWVLRDVLGMTGTKFGCGIAQCGACTVQIDGEPVRSCLLPVGAIGDRKITTIEGIGETGAGRKVQKAWLDLEVVQCGYCQAGEIMSADVLYGPVTARQKAGAVKAELFNTQSVEAGRWPNARTPVVRGRRPN
jgi:isoquinoline 1-oxidoreductase alpha subunit